MARHVRKGDEVIITAGDFKGQTGKVVRILTKQDRVIVHGAGIQGITRNLRRTRINPERGQVMVDRSFHISNVSPVVEGKPTRVRFESKKDGSKARVAVKGGKVLSDLRAARKKK